MNNTGQTLLFWSTPEYGEVCMWILCLDWSERLYKQVNPLARIESIHGHNYSVFGGIAEFFSKLQTLTRSDWLKRIAVYSSSKDERFSMIQCFDFPCRMF